jgi:hypothetical protein
LHRPELWQTLHFAAQLSDATPVLYRMASSIAFSVFSLAVIKAVCFRCEKPNSCVIPAGSGRNDDIAMLTKTAETNFCDFAEEHEDYGFVASTSGDGPGA